MVVRSSLLLACCAFAVALHVSMFARSLSCFVGLLCGKADPLFAANEVSLYRTQTQLQAGDAYFSYSDLHRCSVATWWVAVEQAVFHRGPQTRHWSGVLSFTTLQQDAPRLLGRATHRYECRSHRMLRHAMPCADFPWELLGVRVLQCCAVRRLQMTLATSVPALRPHAARSTLPAACRIRSYKSCSR